MRSEKISRRGLFVTGRLADRAHLATRALNLSSHVEDVTRLLAVEDLESAVLVGHSYGGMVVTAAGAKEHMRLARIVYLDAMVPDSGQRGFDVFSPAIAERWAAMMIELAA